MNVDFWIVAAVVPAMSLAIPIVLEEQVRACSMCWHERKELLAFTIQREIPQFLAASEQPVANRTAPLRDVRSLSNQNGTTNCIVMRHFVHLSSEQRALALETVCDARRALERDLFSGRGAHPFGFEVAASVGCRRGVERYAVLNLHATGMTLGFWSEKGREVGKMRITDETAGSVHVPRGRLSWIVSKLDAWSEGLREEADWNDRMSVEQARSKTIGIITAAAQKYDPSWTNAYLTRDATGKRPVLHRQTFSKGMSAAQVFHGGQARGETGGMTQALEHLIATTADPFIHVTVGVGPRNPWVKIGSPPTISFSNPRDPIAYLRSFSTITDDAHLLPPGCLER